MEVKIVIPDRLDTTSEHILLYPSISTDVDYIPVNAMVDGEVFFTNKNRVIYYHLMYNTSSYTVRNFRLFSKYIVSASGHYYDNFRLVNANIKKRYTASTGSVLYYPDDNINNAIPMLQLCVKKRRLFNPIDRNNPDPTRFCLVIDKKFMEDEEHFKLYRNVKKFYIDEMSKIVDIVYVDSILASCFNAEIEAPTFSTIAEMRDFSKNINKLLV
jgi:hypothetical protein